MEKAEISYYKDEDGIFVVSFEGEASATPIKSLPDTEGLHAKPAFEFVLRLPTIPQISLKPGKSFSIVSGDDTIGGEFFARLYYVDHQAVNEVTISILSRSTPSFVAHITGITCDVNFYDESRAQTKVEIESIFTLKIP